MYLRSSPDARLSGDKARRNSGLDVLFVCSCVFLGRAKERRVTIQLAGLLFTPAREGVTMALPVSTSGQDTFRLARPLPQLLLLLSAPCTVGL